MPAQKLRALVSLAESGDVHGAAMLAVRLLMESQHPEWAVATVVAHAEDGKVIGSHRLRASALPPG